MQQPLVSIIVPVYNSAPYLPACLDSLRAQTWNEIEIILVNDGSTDESLALCRAAQAEDSRFRVFDQPNAGVSSARNLALTHARGKYLQFLDSDDTLTPDATACLVSEAETTGADLVISHFYRVTDERTSHRGHIRTHSLLTRQEFAEYMMKAPANFYYGVLWNKLYRRSIVEKYELRFEPEVHWCEDFLFNLEYIRYARLISALPKPLYFYYKRPGSLVQTQATLRRSIQMKKTTFAYYKDLYQTLDLYEERKVRVHLYLLSAATDGAGPSLPPLRSDESSAKRAYRKQMRRQRRIRKKKNSPLQKLRSCAYNKWQRYP